jgi:hypothetical protein
MTDDDILHLEAQEFLRQATSEMLELATLQELDLNALARQELQFRNPRWRTPGFTP